MHHPQLSHIRMEIIACEVCGSKIKRYNWLKHLQTKKHKKEAKDEDLTHLAGVGNSKRCWKCQADRNPDMFKGKGMRRAIDALNEIKGGLRRSAKERRRRVTNERMRRKNAIRNMQ